MSTPPPSIRSLARVLRLAPSTVCDALRGKGRVSARTVRRVRAAAKRAGYIANPLTGAVLAEVRRRRAPSFRGTVATVDLQEPSHWPHGPFSAALIEGARQRAAQLGFSLECFTAGAARLPIRRLDSILQSRGIHGVIVLPAWYEPDLSELNWRQYAGIYTDYVMQRPGLHSVCTEHYSSMLALLDLLWKRGYARPGLILQEGRDERIQQRQTAGLRTFQALHDLEPIPVLRAPDLSGLRAAFARWFRRFRPDVVLSHFLETPQWMEACGARPPRTGFVILNVIESVAPCAGLDLQPRLLGARAAEQLIAQILRNELGVPEWPSRTTIQARWVEGPTVRPPGG